MDEKLDKELCQKFPKLYKDRNAPMNTTCMCWGFDVGTGWYNLIYNLSEKLEALINNLPQKDQEHFCAVQVKEKFGGLRFYMTSQTKEMSEEITKAESLSYHTCEDCGSNQAKQNNEGWISTLCSPCRKKRSQKK